MSPQLPVELGRDALMVALYTAGPILAVGTLIGLLIGLAQALTQVQDQTLAFVPKLAAMAAAVLFCLPWILQHLVDYTSDLIRNIPQTISGG